MSDLGSGSEGVACGLLLGVQGVAMEESSQILATPAAAGGVCRLVHAVLRQPEVSVCVGYVCEREREGCSRGIAGIDGAKQHHTLHLHSR